MRAPCRCVDCPSGNKHRKYESAPPCTTASTLEVLGTTTATEIDGSTVWRPCAAHDPDAFGSAKNPYRTSGHFCSCGMRYSASTLAPIRPEMHRPPRTPPGLRRHGPSTSRAGPNHTTPHNRRGRIAARHAPYRATESAVQRRGVSTLKITREDGGPCSRPRQPSSP